MYLNYTSDIVGSFYSFDTNSFSLLSPKFSVFNLSLDDFMLELKIVTSWLLNCSRKYRGMVSQRDFFYLISRDRKRCRRKNICIINNRNETNKNAGVVATENDSLENNKL